MMTGKFLRARSRKAVRKSDVSMKKVTGVRQEFDEERVH